MSCAVVSTETNLTPELNDQPVVVISVSKRTDQLGDSYEIIVSGKVLAYLNSGKDDLKTIASSGLNCKEWQLVSEIINFVGR